MLMNDYQNKALETAKFPPVGNCEFFYPVLGLCGESGEVLEKISTILNNANIDETIKKSILDESVNLSVTVSHISEKIKKIIRDKKGILAPEDVTAIGKELGDVMWYLSVLAKYIGLTLEEVAQMNIDKLTSRKERNVIHGSGDNR